MTIIGNNPELRAKKSQIISNLKIKTILMTNALWLWRDFKIIISLRVPYLRYLSLQKIFQAY